MSRFSTYSRVAHYKFVQQALPPGGALLDVGCGDATALVSHLQHGPRGPVFGLELFAAEAKAAASNGIKVAIADLNKGWPVLSSAFDVVSSNQVIEHLVETDVFATECLRILKPGGGWRPRSAGKLKGRGPEVWAS